MTTLFKNKCKSADQTLGHTYRELSAWWFCIWSLQSSSRVCVGIYGLTYSLYHPRGSISIIECPDPVLNYHRNEYSQMLDDTRSKASQFGDSDGTSLDISLTYQSWGLNHYLSDATSQMNNKSWEIFTFSLYKLCLVVGIVGISFDVILATETLKWSFS